jgi:hypothetical protein
MASLQRFVIGVFFAVLYKWGIHWVSDSYLNTPEFFVNFFKFNHKSNFKALPLIWKIIWNTIWYKATMYRYCVVWLLTVFLDIFFLFNKF